MTTGTGNTYSSRRPAAARIFRASAGTYSRIYSSTKLFTLSAIYNGTSALLGHGSDGTIEELAQKALTFWEEVAKHIPEWQPVIHRKMTAEEVRRDFIHSHGIVLQAVGKVGNTLLRNGPGT
jgi:DNA sulfur modification protein DndB